jgi:cytochrome c peroxidase
MATVKPHGLCSILLACAGLAAGAAAAQGTNTRADTRGSPLSNSSGSLLERQSFPDASGTITTLSVNGPIDSHGAFFQSLGTNGRSCATCHVASQAMSISAAGIQQRFVE